MEYQNFELEVADGCARISLIGPGSPNMGHLCDEFTDLMLRLQEDRAVRVILITDGDHSFDLHHNLQDLAESLGQDEGFEMLSADEEIARRLVTTLSESMKPIIAATRGDIRNMGFGFFLAADVRLATTEATFTAPDIAAGLLPGWGLTHALPRLMGPSGALEFLWSGRSMPATEAKDVGLIDRLVEPGHWEEEIENLITRMRSLPQPVVQLTKLGVQQAATMDATTMLSFDWEGQQQCWQSLETADGMKALNEGRSHFFDMPTTDQED